MASSTTRSSLPLPLCLAAIFLCILVFLPAETEARTCVFKCMRSVIACKRKSAISGGEGSLCCEEYYKCFMECKPDATELPPCDSKTGKRSLLPPISHARASEDEFPPLADFF